MQAGTGVRRIAGRWWLPVLGLALVAAAAGNAFSYDTSSRPVAAILSAFCAGAVLLRDRSRWAMTLVLALGLAGLAVLGIGETPMWAFVELLLAAFWASEGLPTRDAAVAIALLTAAGIAFDARSGESSVAGSLVSPLVIVGAPAFAGALLRRSREQAERLRDLTAQLAEQRDRAADAAVLSERARIAREIHDVIAHTVSVMVVQAGAAENQLDGSHPAAEPVGAIRATGKQALAELRRVIGVLRSANEDETHPQPSLADIPALVATVAAGGMEVSVDCDPGLDDVPAGVQLTVFRTIQEALTNARKHAPHAAVTVAVHRTVDGLRVVVDDDGTARSVDAAPGYGLVGLRERADLYGGTLRAGPRPDGSGWRVQLDVPVSGHVGIRESAVS